MKENSLSLSLPVRAKNRSSSNDCPFQLFRVVGRDDQLLLVFFFLSILTLFLQVDDVVNSIMESIYRPETKGATIDLVG